jgi:TonB family protein
MSVDDEIRDNSCNSCRAPARFWGSVAVIALAHIALIAGLIRWSVAAKSSPNPESIVWLDGAGALSSDESKNQEPLSPKEPPTDAESSGSKQNEAADEKPVLTTAKSEIQLPSPTPKATATATPVIPSVTPSSKEKINPKPNATHSVAGGPTPRKILTAKASPKPLAKITRSPVKANAKSEKKDKITLAKNDFASQNGMKKSGSTDKDPSASGSTGSEFGWYGNMLHDRFYRAWIQPTTNVTTGTKISTLVKVRIEKDGRVSRFEIVKPSGDSIINESVRVIAKQVTQVDPPPTGLFKGDHYDVKINFELKTEERPEN